MSWTYAILHRFHRRSSAIMVATETIRDELAANGFERLALWTRGVDIALFRPGCTAAVDLPPPVFLCVSRIAAEKNLPLFLDLDLPGSKLVVGDGLDRRLREMAEKEALKRVSLCIGAPPQDYGVADDADVTVVIYSLGRRPQQKVTANFALRKGELDEAKADAIVKALSEMLPR